MYEKITIESGVGGWLYNFDDKEKKLGLGWPKGGGAKVPGLNSTQGPRNLHKECAHPNGWRDKRTHTHTILMIFSNFVFTDAKIRI